MRNSPALRSDRDDSVVADNRIVRRWETRSAVHAAGFRCWENARRRVSPTGGDDGRLRYRLIDKL